MKCNQTGKMMIDKLAGELSAIQTKILEKHLDSCEACRKEFEVLSKVWQSGKETLEQDSFAQELTQGRRAEIFAVAASEQKRRRSSRFLTRLIEYTAVIVICLILAGMLLPALNQSREKARRISALSIRKQKELEERIKEMNREEEKSEKKQDLFAPAPSAPPAAEKLPRLTEEAPAKKSKRRGGTAILGDDASEVAAEYDQLVKENAAGGKRPKGSWANSIVVDRPAKKAEQAQVAPSPKLAASPAVSHFRPPQSRIKMEKSKSSEPSDTYDSDKLEVRKRFDMRKKPQTVTEFQGISSEVSSAPYPADQKTRSVDQLRSISKIKTQQNKDSLNLDGRAAPDANAPLAFSRETKAANGKMVFYDKEEPLPSKTFKLDLKLWNLTTPANVRKYLIENRYPVPGKIWTDKKKNTVTIQGSEDILKKIEKFFNKLQEEEKELKDFSNGLPFVKCSSRPVSTFSIDTDTASYVQARKGIKRGERPDPLKVRPEEFINYFDYNYRSPQNATFAVYPEAAPSPFRPNNTLFRVGIQGKRLGPGAGTRTHYTILLDTSGSMAVKDRMELAQKALAMMLKKLQPTDYISLLLCGSRTSIAVKCRELNDSNRKKLLASLEKVSPQGVANFADGISTVYSFAGRNFLYGGSNRIVIVSDGIFELSPEGKRNISAQIEAARKRGISNIVIGLGGDGDDDTLEKIASIGDGSYVFLDSEREAEELFNEQFEARFREIARDVKIQVEFNKDTVNSYRQIGYHNRQLSEADFRNDKVDAGEVGSGQSVTALYELKLKDNIPKDAIAATIRIRYKKAEDMSIEEKTFYLYASDIKEKFEDSTANFKLAGYVAEFAESLRYPETLDIASLRGIADKLNTLWMNNYRQNRKVTELLSLIKRCK